MTLVSTDRAWGWGCGRGSGWYCCGWARCWCWGCWGCCCGGCCDGGCWCWGGCWGCSSSSGLRGLSRACCQGLLDGGILRLSSRVADDPLRIDARRPTRGGDGSVEPGRPWGVTARGLDWLLDGGLLVLGNREKPPTGACAEDMMAVSLSVFRLSSLVYSFEFVPLSSSVLPAQRPAREQVAMTGSGGGGRGR